MRKAVQPLPKHGVETDCLQWVRCGRATCPCATGTRHGPYPSLLWREQGRLR